MKKTKGNRHINPIAIADASLRSYHLTVSTCKPAHTSPTPLIPAPYDFFYFISMDEEFPLWLRETWDHPGQNCLYTSPSGLTWMYLAVPGRHSRNDPPDSDGIYLGPVFFSAPSRNFLKAHRMKEICLPVMDFLEFTRLCHYIYTLLVPDDEEDFSFSIFRIDNQASLTEEEMYFSQTRDYANIRFLEKQLTSMVKSGNLKGLEKMAAGISLASPARLASDDLRNEQNRFIVTLTLVMRAAVDGGLPPEIAYPLSDVYLQENETLTSVSQAVKFLMTAVFDYTRRVRDCKKYSSFSPLVRRCHSLILANLNENLKISALASRLSVSPDHLSRQFKKETGQSILDYIQSQKTEEAMRLLRYTDFSLVTIAHRLGYNSQGHFTEKFKQNVGITPGKWRARLQSVPPEEFPRQTPSL